MTMDFYDAQFYMDTPPGEETMIRLYACTRKDCDVWFFKNVSQCPSCGFPGKQVEGGFDTDIITIYNLT